VTGDGDLADGSAAARPPTGPDPLDGAVRRALRDLIPDYSGPPDPLLRVRRSIRRRRARRRALLAVGSAAAVATLLAGVPAILGAVGPDRGRTAPAAGRPTPTGPPSPAPLVYPVGSGIAAGSAWRVGSTFPGGAARRCLLTDGAGFAGDLVCFDDRRPGDPLSWTELAVRAGSTPVVRVAGVAPAGTAEVSVRRADGSAVRVEAVATPTDPDVRFFATVLEGPLPVLSVTPLGADHTPVGAAVTEPAPLSCRPLPDNACASPQPTG
jgi:hypothetical protein